MLFLLNPNILNYLDCQTKSLIYRELKKTITLNDIQSAHVAPIACGLSLVGLFHPSSSVFSADEKGEEPELMTDLSQTVFNILIKCQEWLF